MSKRPILLTKDALKKPVTLAKNKLDVICSNVPSDGKKNIIREGLFALSVSKVEVMILDILSVILKYIPFKLPDKSFSIQKDTLINSELSLIDVNVNNYVSNLGYKNLNEILDALCGILSIDLNSFRSSCEDNLQEIKETRNLLLHNDLRVNSFYLSKAGPKARSGHMDELLTIDYKYFIESIEILNNLCVYCEQEIESKYAKYTKYKAIKSLWEYIFNSPILEFDDYWQSSPDGSNISMKKTKFHGGASSSERIFLGVWINHFNMNKNDYIKEFNLISLDTVNKEKMVWLISTLRDFKLY